MKKKRKIRFRKPVPQKPSHPIGSKKGKRGYNRNNKHKEQYKTAVVVVSAGSPRYLYNY